METKPNTNTNENTSHEEETEPILFTSWLLEEGDNYNVKFVFPDSKNSTLGKRVAQEAIENNLEINVPLNSTPREIEALFNYKLSFLAEKTLINTATLHYENIAKIDETINSSIFSSLDESQQNDIINGVKEIRKEYIGYKQDIEKISPILADKDIVKRFLEGDVWYEDNDTEAKERAMKEIALKSETPLTSDGDIVLASDLLRRIETALIRAEELVSRYDTIIKMSNDTKNNNNKEQEENEAIESMLPLEAKESINSESILVDTKSNSKPEEDNISPIARQMVWEEVAHRNAVLIEKPFDNSKSSYDEYVEKDITSSRNVDASGQKSAEATTTFSDQDGNRITKDEWEAQQNGNSKDITPWEEVVANNIDVFSLSGEEEFVLPQNNEHYPQNNDTISDEEQADEAVRSQNENNFAYDEGSRADNVPNTSSPSPSVEKNEPISIKERIAEVNQKVKDKKIQGKSASVDSGVSQK